jgi:hypothetical protein
VNVASHVLDLSAIHEPTRNIEYPEDPTMWYMYGFRVTGRGSYWQDGSTIAPARDLASPEVFAAKIIEDAHPSFLVGQLTTQIVGQGHINIWVKDWSYVKRMAKAHVNRNADVTHMRFRISSALQRALGWRQDIFNQSSQGILPEWPADSPVDSLPPELQAIDRSPPPPRAPTPPPSPEPCPAPVAHHPVNIFCEGVAATRFQRGEVKPFVDTMCLETHGGQLSDRLYATPLTWMPPPTPGRLRELIMWVEDDMGPLPFPPSARMAILATWRTYST